MNREPRPTSPPVRAEEPQRARYFDELEHKLREAAETIEAIRRGTVDGVVVDGPRGARVFTLEGPDEPFRTFVEGMQEGALTLAADGTVLYANGFFAGLLQLPVQQIVGMPLSAFVAPEYKFTTGELVAQGIVKSTKGTLRLQGPGGTIPVQLTLSPLPGADPARCCSVVFDLRAREQAEHANAAREAAEQANNAKDRFLAVLGHELRSPLSTILGWSQILSARSDLSDVNRRAVQAIERNARAQAQLIGDLLDISRVVTGKLHLELDVVDFTAIVETAVASVRIDLDKGVDIIRDFPESETFVTGDATRLSQVVTNILTNAVKFTDPGGFVRIAIRDDGAYVELSVTDSGIGIAPDQIRYIFDLFRQGHTTINRNKSGLGLGMAIAKHFTEQMHGSISFESEVNVGTTFHVDFPIAHAEARAKQA